MSHNLAERVQIERKQLAHLAVFREARQNDRTPGVAARVCEIGEMSDIFYGCSAQLRSLAFNFIHAEWESELRDCEVMFERELNCGRPTIQSLGMWVTRIESLVTTAIGGNN